MKPGKLRPPCFIEVARPNDLARLACAFERAPIPVFCFTFDSQMLLAVQLDIYKATPILYYLKTAEAGQFLGYRNSGGVETVSFSGSAKDSSYLYAPVIVVEKPPNIYERGFTSANLKREKYLPMMLRDLSSLAKIALYKIIFEEPPLPLYAFPSGSGWTLGTFARLDESEEASVFFYITLDHKPSHSFIRYSNDNPEKITLTGNIDEHGYLYAKIVELVAAHPLVQV